MLQVFNFEDDSLPKVRRALVFTSSLLLFSVITGIKIDLTGGLIKAGEETENLLENFLPSLVLVPMLCYLIIRAIAVAIWYLPLSKSEFVRDRPDFKELSKHVEAYSKEAIDREYYIRPVGDISILELSTSINILRNVSEKIDQGIAEIKGVGNRALPSKYDEVSNEEVTSVKGIVYRAQAEIRKTELAAEKLRATVDQYRALFESLDVEFDILKGVKGEANSLKDAIDKNKGPNSLKGIVIALGRMDADIFVAAGRKYLIELWLGFLMPLMFSVVIAAFGVCEIIEWSGALP